MKNNFRNPKKGQQNNKSLQNQRSPHRPGKGHSLVNRKESEIPRNWRAVTGQHAIQELLAQFPKDIEVAYLKQGWSDSEDLTLLEKTLRRLNIKVEEKSVQSLEKISNSHQGAILFASKQPEVNWEKLVKKDQSVVVLLDGIEDPHNLGAITRTSWLLQVDVIVTPQDRAVGLTPVVHKVACGGVEHVPIEKVNQFATTVEHLKENGYWVYGLSHKATKTIYDIDLPEKIVWAIGAEDKGLRTTTERLCDELVSIPQSSPNASFNASVATAIALSETKRAHMRRDKMKKTQ